MSGLELRELPEMRLAAIGHQGAYHRIGPAFERLGSVLGAADGFGDTRGLVGVYYDNPMVTPEPELRSHAGAVWAGGAIPDGLEEVVIPAGRYAVYTHVGPYDGLAAAWQELSPEAIAELGVGWREAPALEIYLDDPGNTPEDRLRTDLCVAVA